MKRRDLLKRGLQSLAVVSIPITLSTARAAIDKIPSGRAIFRSYLDTLIPADLTPSASQLGMDEKLLWNSNAIEDYPELIQLGCQWLDSVARAKFHAGFEHLALEQREWIVSQAEASPPASIPKQFFEHIKADLFGFYYAHPASWTGLGLLSPPQPIGYPDYTELPVPKSKRHG